MFTLVFAVSLLLGDRPAASRLVLVPAAFARGEDWWTPLTAPFLFPDGHLPAIAFTLIVQWFLGSAVEAVWGTRRWLATIVGSAVLGYLVAGLVPLAWAPARSWPALAGATPLDLAATTAFGFALGDREHRLSGLLHPIRGRVIAGFTVLLVLALPFARAGGIDAWPTILPSVVAVLGTALAARPWRRRAKSGTIGGRKPRKNGPKLRVVERADDLLN